MEHYTNSGSKREDLLKESAKLDAEKFATCPNINFKIKKKYAPLTSVEIEMSFSIYRTILIPNRQNLLFQNIEMLNVIKFNSFE